MFRHLLTRRRRHRPPQEPAGITDSRSAAPYRRRPDPMPRMRYP